MNHKPIAMLKLAIECIVAGAIVYAFVCLGLAM
jgi:hypothetical protein